MQYSLSSLFTNYLINKTFSEARLYITSVKRVPGLLLDFSCLLTKIIQVLHKQVLLKMYSVICLVRTLACKK